MHYYSLYGLDMYWKSGCIINKKGPIVYFLFFFGFRLAYSFIYLLNNNNDEVKKKGKNCDV